MVSTGFGADGKFRSFTRLRVAHETVNNAGRVLDRDRLYYTIQFAVNRVISFISFDGWVGEEIDFAKNRLGEGANVNFSATLRPTNRLQVNLTTGIRWLNVNDDRLFTSQVESMRANYTFNPRMFLRALVQNQRTHRDRALAEVETRFAGGLASQLLFAYKLSWQTVAYIGYGDLREVVNTTGQEGEFEPSSRQFFAKISYAFQR